METNTNQGNVNKVNTPNAETKGRNRSTSASYTLKSTAANIVKLRDLKLITKEQAVAMSDILDKAVSIHIQNEFGR